MTGKEVLENLVFAVMERRSKCLELSKEYYKLFQVPDSRCLGQIAAYDDVLSLLDSVLNPEADDNLAAEAALKEMSE